MSWAAQALTTPNPLPLTPNPYIHSCRSTQRRILNPNPTPNAVPYGIPSGRANLKLAQPLTSRFNLHTDLSSLPSEQPCSWPEPSTIGRGTYVETCVKRLAKKTHYPLVRSDTHGAARTHPVSIW